MRMRTSFIGVFGLLTACVVPIDVPRFVGTVGGGSAAGGQAGGSAGGAVACTVPSDLGAFVAGTSRTIEFLGCARATFSSEPGVVVTARANTDGSASVEIGPSALGVWTLTIATEGTTITRELLVDEFAFDERDLLNAGDAGLAHPKFGFVRRYVDRVDTCTLVTPAGRALCSANPNSLGFLYGLDGGIEQDFTGHRQAFNLGEELWAVRSPDTLERYLETPTGLVPAGALDVPGFRWASHVESGRVVTAVGTTVFDVVADGGAIELGRLRTEHMQFPQGLGILLVDGQDALWSGRACRLEPGCTTTLCDVVETCDEASGNLVGATATHAIVHQFASNGPSTTLLRARPLDSRSVLHSRLTWDLVSKNWRPEAVSWSPLALFDKYEWTQNGHAHVGYVEAIVRSNRILFRSYRFSLDSLVAFTPEWLVLRVSPRELRFIHR